MQLKWILAGFVSTMVSSSVFAQVPKTAEDMEMAIIGNQTKIKKARERIAEINKEIGKCDPLVGGYSHRLCNRGFTTVPETDYQKLKKESGELEKKVQELQGAIETNKQNATLAKYTQDVKNLMLDKKIFDTELKAVGLDLKTIYLKMDQSVLGDYTKYVAAEYAKSDEMKANICNTVNTCSSVKNMKTTVDKHTKSIKSFEAFKAEYQKSSSPTASPTTGVQ